MWIYINNLGQVIWLAVDLFLLRKHRLIFHAIFFLLEKKERRIIQYHLLKFLPNNTEWQQNWQSCQCWCQGDNSSSSEDENKINWHWFHWTLICSAFTNSVRTRSVCIFQSPISGSALFVIHHANLYQQPGLSSVNYKYFSIFTLLIFTVFFFFFFFFRLLIFNYIYILLLFFFSYGTLLNNIRISWSDMIIFLWSDVKITNCF